MQLVIKFNLEIEYLKKMKDLYFLQKIWAIGKTISKNLNGNYSQKLLTHAKQSATGALKTASKRAIQRTAEATDYLIDNKIDGKITAKNFTAE